MRAILNSVQPPVYAKALGVILCLILGSANAEVFGLSKGMTVDEIRGVTSGFLFPMSRDGSLQVPQRPTEFLMDRGGLPQSNELFDHYVLHISPTAGLCGIEAFGVGWSSLSDTHPERNRLINALKSVYGEPTKNHGIRNALFGYGELEKGNVDDVLEAEWLASDGGRLKNDVAHIALLTERLEDGSQYRAFASYIFDNHMMCGDLATVERDKTGL